jgi:hypothetical protein
MENQISFRSLAQIFPSDSSFRDDDAGGGYEEIK